MSLMVETNSQGVNVTIHRITCTTQVEYVACQIAEQIRLGYRRIHLCLAETAADVPGLQEMLQQAHNHLQRCAGSLTVESL